MSISLILLAGGQGTRMQSSIPKQFLELEGKPIALHSLEIFKSISEIKEIVVVVDEKYRSFFSGVLFADPGKRRQDSLWNGLKKAQSEWILTHDAARPLFTKEMVGELIKEGKKWGAATLAVPLKPTIKESNRDGIIEKTLDRSKLVEIQTPQFLKRELLLKGFAKAHSENLEVTDDTSLAELLGHPVKAVMGSYFNLKITTQEDLLMAQYFIQKKA